MSTRQVDASHYWAPHYLTKERVCSFWHQFDEVRALEPRGVLEVGPGPGVVTGWLREVGLAVTTLDMADDIDADVVGSVADIPLADDAVDVALCAQVLEHLPWSEVPRALGELRRVARRAVVLTVPDVSPYAGTSTPLYWGLYVERVRASVPPTRRALALALLRRRIRLRDWLFTRAVPAQWAIGGSSVALPSWAIPHVPWHHEFDGEHHWEIGTTDVALEDFLDVCAAAGLALERSYRVPENPFHHVVVAQLQ